MSRYWRCRRVSQSIPCNTLNLARKRKCTECGKPKPPKRKPAHMAALELPYEWYVERFGENCGICGVGPSDGRRLDRDHEHKGNGRPRGLLCRKHNRMLKRWLTDDFMRQALAYLERAES